MASSKRPVALTYGLISGLVMILVTYVLYLGGVKSYLGAQAYLAYAFMIAMAVLATWTQKKANGGYLEFRKALQIVFTVFVIALAAQALFNWLLLNYLDTNFRNVVTQATLTKTEELLHKMGMTDDQIDKAMTEARGSSQFTLPKTILGLMFWYVIYFLVALLIAAIMKKKKPEFTDAL